MSVHWSVAVNKSKRLIEKKYSLPSALADGHLMIEKDVRVKTEVKEKRGIWDGNKITSKETN